MRTWKDVAVLVEQNDRKIQEEILNNPYFDVRSDGTIWTLLSRNGCGLAPSGNWRKMGVLDKDGYLRITLTVNNRRCEFRVHRIIFMKFKGSLSGEMVINHINGVKTDNRPENLELVSMAENNRHKYDVLKHDPIQHAKLSFEVADEIRALKKSGWSHRQLCEKFNISKGHVSEIVNNKIWVRAA